MEENKNIILLIDDDRIICKVLRRILISKIKNTEVLCSCNVNEVLNIVVNNKIDIILLDVDMPNVNGFEMCRRLRKLSVCKDVPIIFLTNESDTESILKGYSLGANDYITKPFNKDILLARVNIYLKIKASMDLIKNQNKLILEKDRELEFLLSNTTDIIWRLDKKLNIEYINTSNNFLGYRKEELYRIPLEKIITKESLTVVERNIKRVSKIIKRKNINPLLLEKKMELQHINKKGDIIWGETNAKVILDDKNRIIAYCGITRDITERKNQEQMVMKAKYILDNTTSVLYMFTYRTEIAINYISENINYYGYSQNDMMSGKIGFNDILANEDKQKFYKDLICNLKSKKDKIIQEFRIIDKSGNRHWVEMLSKKYKMRRDYILEGILVDISHRKELERKIMESKVQLETIIENIPYGVWMKDVKGKYILVNNTYSKILGKSRDKIIGNMDKSFYRFKEARDSMQKDMILLKGAMRKISNVMEINERKYQVVRMSLFDDNDELIGILGLVRDITMDAKKIYRREEKIKDFSQRINEEVENKNKELLIKSLKIEEDNQIYMKMRDMLSKVIDSTHEEFSYKILRDVISLINNAVNDKNTWDAKYGLETLDKDFYKKIIKKHNVLTNNDIKLCSLVRLSMTNKEIARVLNITEGSVKIAKNRLKKKLGLKDKDKIVNYLRSF